mmetsp:Transcript_39287/g.99011  ORF Transcript_39287/g.99011 Transcript_39287/m.99011 type:complete len:469 (-) Transcript_39287:189-1595(-)
MLFVGLLGMTHLVELWGGCQHGATEPHGVTLHVMTDDVDSERDGADLTTAQLFTTLDTVVDGALHITLQSLAKVLEHGRATTEHDVLVEATTGINRTALDSVIHHLGQGSEKLGRENLRVEEHLGAEETLVADIHGERTLGHRLDALVLLDPLFRLRIVLLVLTDDIGTHVAVGLLHTLGNLEGLSGRDNTAALTLTLQLLHERRHITTGQRNVLDGTADNITLSDRDDVSDTITRVNHSTSEGTLGHLLRGPRRSQRKHSLHSNVQTGDVESLEHDLGSVLTVLGSVKRRLSQQKVMILRFTSKILEDAVFPVAFNVGPVVNLTMTDRVVHTVGLGVSLGLVTDEEVQIFDALLARGGSASLTTLQCCLVRIHGGDHRRDNEVGLAVAGVAHLCVTGTIVDDNSGKTRSRHDDGGMLQRVNGETMARQSKSARKMTVAKISIEERLEKKSDSRKVGETEKKTAVLLT